MSRTKAALNGRRAKNSFSNKLWILQSSGIRPRLCVSAGWLFVARDIYFWITKVQAALIYTQAHSLSEARVSGLQIFAGSCDLWRQFHSRSVTESRCGPDLGRMSLITELITHKLRIPALLFYCLLRVMLHVILILSRKTIKEMCIFPFIHPTRHSNDCIAALTSKSDNWREEEWLIRANITNLQLLWGQLIITHNAALMQCEQLCRALTPSDTRAQ